MLNQGVVCKHCYFLQLPCVLKYVQPSFVCSTRRQKVGSVLFRSYASKIGEVEPTIWEAGRATSAAATFFDPISIGPYEEQFIDGATESNNPIERMMEEARRIWENIDVRLGCIVSIGTGQSPLMSWGDNALKVVGTLKSLATETEKTENRFRMSHEGRKWNKLYFRFNVERGLENIGLEEHKKKAELATATRIYLAQHDTQERIASFLETVLSPEKALNERTKHSMSMRTTLFGTWS